MKLESSKWLIAIVTIFKWSIISVFLIALFLLLINHLLYNHKDLVQIIYAQVNGP